VSIIFVVFHWPEPSRRDAITLRPNNEIVEGEARPRQRHLLHEETR
jgi:hypothetical protein